MDWAIVQQRLVLAQTFCLRLLFKAHLIGQEHLGTLVTLFGNSVALRGLRFDVNHPSVTRTRKGEMVLGWYEGHELFLIRDFLPVDLPVIELGGSLGVVACRVNHRLADPTRHWVVEANPELIPILKKNRTINHCQFQVVAAALGYSGPTISFLIDPEDPLQGSVYPTATATESVTVPARTLQSIAEEAGFDQFGLVCDIEGSEYDLLEQELPFLCAHVSWIMIEMHDSTPRGPAARQAALDTIQTIGYVLKGQIADCYFFQRHTDSQAMKN